MSKDESEMHILKIANTKSITGKSTLTYQIGCTSDDSVHIRISKNTGAGFFNDEWIAIKDIEEVLAKGPQGQPLTSFLLQPLFRGASSNSPGFLFAALLQEKYLRVMKGKKRGHELLDPEGFIARMDKLVSTKAKPKTVRKATGTPRKTTSTATKKAAIKKRSAARRKQQ